MLRVFPLFSPLFWKKGVSQNNFCASFYKIYSWHLIFSIVFVTIYVYATNLKNIIHERDFQNEGYYFW